MLRKFIASLSIAAHALLGASQANAVEITSGLDSITALKETFSFDFTGDSDLGSVNSFSTLTGVAVDWVFTPGPGATGVVKLSSRLGISGTNTSTGMDITFDQAGIPPSALAVNYASSGLVFGNIIRDDLLANAGIVAGLLTLDGPSVPDLTAFFATGGKIDATVRLTFEEGVDPGGQVPEPASLLVWGALGAGALARRRYLARKQA